MSEDNPDISISNMALAHNKRGVTTEKCWGCFRVMPLRCCVTGRIFKGRPIGSSYGISAVGTEELCRPFV